MPGSGMLSPEAENEVLAVSLCNFPFSIGVSTADTVPLPDSKMEANVNIPELADVVITPPPPLARTVSDVGPENPLSAQSNVH